MPTPEIISAAGSRQTPLVESLDLWSSQEHHRVRLFSSPARYFSQVLSQLLQVGLLPTYSVLLFSLCPSFRPLHLALQSNRPRLLSQSTGSAPLCPCLPIFTLQILSGQVHMPPPPGSLPQHPFRALPSFLLVSLHTHSAPPPRGSAPKKYSHTLQTSEQSSFPVWTWTDLECRQPSVPLFQLGPKETI